MNENPGKENKEPELLYRLDRRNPLMVMIDFIGYSFLLLVPGLLPRYIIEAGCRRWAFWVLCFWVGFYTNSYFSTTSKFTATGSS